MRKDFGPVRGKISLILAGFSYATFGVFSRLIGKDFGAFFQAWSRGIVVLLFFVSLGLLSKSYKKIKKEDLIWFFLVSLGGSLTIAPFYIAAINIPLGTTLFIFYALNTLSAYALGSLVFKEKLNLIKLSSVVLAIIGLFLIYKDSIIIFKLKYLFFAAISGSLFSFYSIFSKKISSKYSVVQVSTFNFIFVVLVNLFLSVVNKELFYFNFLTTSWLSNIVYAIAQIAATFFVISGFRNVEAQLGSLILLSEVLFAVVFGVFLYGEVLSPITIAGGALILLGMAIPNLNFNKVNSKYHE